jgi:hypothetical protein
MATNSSVAAINASLERLQQILGGLSAAAESTEKLLRKAARVFGAVCMPLRIGASRASRANTDKQLVVALLRGKVAQISEKFASYSSATVGDASSDSATSDACFSEEALLLFLEERCRSFAEAFTAESPASTEEALSRKKLRLEAVARKLLSDWHRGISFLQSAILCARSMGLVSDRPSYRWTFLADINVRVKSFVEGALAESLGAANDADDVASLISKNIISKLRSQSDADSSSPGMLETCAQAFAKLLVDLQEHSLVSEEEGVDKAVAEVLAHMIAASSLMSRLSNKAKTCEESLGKQLVSRATKLGI